MKSMFYERQHRPNSLGNKNEDGVDFLRLEPKNEINLVHP
jgi:hypothetical protein